MKSWVAFLKKVWWHVEKWVMDHALVYWKQLSSKDLILLKFLWVGSLLGYDFKQSFSWYLVLLLNTPKPKKEIARATDVHCRHGWLTVAWAPRGCVGPHGGASGSVRPTQVWRTHADRGRKRASRAAGGRRRKYMNANRSHTRLHTHWRCPSVFPLDMFRGASRGENTYKRWTQPGQLRKCWPNLFIFFAWCSTCYLITYAQLYIFTVSLWHQHFNHGHTWQWLHQSFCQGTWTCDDILGGFILEGKLCKKKKKKMSLWWFFLNRTSCWRPHIKHSNNSGPPLDINCTVRN